MAMAPVAYTLWQRFLRFDPERPDLAQPRPLRALGRARLDAALLAAAPRARAGGGPRLRDGRRALGEPRRHQELSPARLEGARASGVPLDLGRRDARPGRSARGSRPRSGWRSRRSGWQAHFNRPGFELFDFDVYVIAGDGDMMEGVSNEAASFAGHQQLDNLCWIYDNNHISIDGHTVDHLQRRRRGALHGLRLERGPGRRRQRHRRCWRARSSASAREERRPTLIIVDSHIGYGSPHKQDTAAAHGEPLGEEEVRETKRSYGWPEDAEFLVPDGVYDHFADGRRRARRDACAATGSSSSTGTRADAPELADELEPHAAPRAARRLGRRHPELRRRRRRGWRRARPRTRSRTPSPRRLPWLVAGSADLTDSTSVRLTFDGADGDFQPDERAGPPAPLRHPRARVGGDLQRPLAVEAPPALVDVPDVLRLRPAGDPALGADGAAGHPRLHARLDRPRRGRPHAPAGRAARLAARDPGPQRDPPLRRERGRRGLAADDRAAATSRSRSC